MAQVNVERIVDHLSAEMRRALVATLKEVAPEVSVEAFKLFRVFRRQVGRKCTTWETVPDNYVQ